MWFIGTNRQTIVETEEKTESSDSRGDGTSDDCWWLIVKLSFLNILWGFVCLNCVKNASFKFHNKIFEFYKVLNEENDQRASVICQT